MSWIVSIANRVIKSNVPKPIYGRWGMDYKPDQVDTRIDLANEDHCGPCGTYAMSKESKDFGVKNRLSHENMVKFGIMQRRGFHSTPNMLIIDSVSMPILNPNGFDSLGGDYMEGLPESVMAQIPQTTTGGPGQDPDDDDEPPEDGPSPVLVAASLLASYRITQEQLNN